MSDDIGSRQNSVNMGSRMVSNISSEYQYEYSQDFNSESDVVFDQQRVEVHSQLRDNALLGALFQGSQYTFRCTFLIETLHFPVPKERTAHTLSPKN